MTAKASAQLMDGSGVARQIPADTTERARQFTNNAGRRPCLAAVPVGDDPASVTYVKMKQSRCHKAGIDSRLVHLPAKTSTAQVVEGVDSLSADPTVDGVLVQHPVPDQVDERTVFEAITSTKDVDGVTMHSFAAMGFGLPGLQSCTPGGIIRLLDAYQVQITGRRAVVIGRSPILGKPVGMLLLARDAIVTYCHSHTSDLPDLLAEGDIVVAAVGNPRFIRGEWLKPGAVVVDAGYNPGNIGDIDFDTAAQVASLITPVPGGVGPMTIAVLLEQTVQAAETAALGRTIGARS